MVNSTTQETFVLALDLLRPTVTLGESLPLSGSQLCHLQNRNNHLYSAHLSCLL